ncbi:MAG: type IV pilus assembly protein PilM [Armatimonadetes bacterium]|nr:type IV pilus assembly protein PilM [Armatimonadota bacterium]
MGLFPKRTYVGIDIGHHTIKALQLEKSGDVFKVVNYACTPTPAESVRDGVISAPDLIGDAIKDLLKQGHFHASSAHIAVTGASVFVRPVKLPKMPEIALRRSIKYEASRYVPGTPEESYIDFEILGETEDGQMEVLIVAAPREIVESRLAAFAVADLEVESVEVEAFATYRALIESDTNRPWNLSTFALVDVGSITTNLSIIAKGQFAMTRAIPHGGQMWTDALKSYFKLNEDDAEAGKAQLDLAELLDEARPRENPPLRVLQPHLDELVREIRRSLNYYQSQLAEGQTGSPVESIILTGGATKLKGFERYVEHKLGIKCEKIGLFSSTRFLHSGDPEADGLELSVASGLAMRAFSKAA